MIWHFYPGEKPVVPIGSTALCGHVAVEETRKQIEPGDTRCDKCVHLLDLRDAER